MMLRLHVRSVNAHANTRPSGETRIPYASLRSANAVDGETFDHHGERGFDLTCPLSFGSLFPAFLQSEPVAGDDNNLRTVD